MFWEYLSYILYIKVLRDNLLVNIHKVKTYKIGKTIIIVVRVKYIRFNWNKMYSKNNIYDIKVLTRYYTISFKFEFPETYLFLTNIMNINQRQKFNIN